MANPSVTHVASHGYLDATSDSPRGLVHRENRDVRPGEPAPALLPIAPTAHPMLRSAVVLAEANGKGDGEGTDDGMLTAGELAGLDLRGTTLVTLSACSTGEGELRQGDGVYGLRRALVLAGSRTQVLSLWEVDDAATSFLMKRFYKALRRGATVRHALTEAQQATRDRSAWRHPYYWAAFTVSGDPFATLR